MHNISKRLSNAFYRYSTIESHNGEYKRMLVINGEDANGEEVRIEVELFNVDKELLSGYKEDFYY